MAQGPNDSNHYSAPDFERYYSGGMTAQEMHALEKAALDDPFLADALEGYKATRTPVGDTAWLREQLEAKTRRAKVVPLVAQRRFPLLRVAVLVLLLVGAGWSVYYLMDSKKDTLALDTKPERHIPAATAPAPVTATDTTPKVETTPGQGHTPVPSTSTVLTRKRTTKSIGVAPRTQPVATAIAPTPPVTNVATAEAPRTMLRAEDRSQDVATIQSRPVSIDKALQGQAAGVQVDKAGEAPQKGTRIVLRGASSVNGIQGRVVNQNNQAVAGATVSIPGTRTGVTTNEEGYFFLNVPDTTVAASIAAVGYQVQNTNLSKSNRQNQIVLKESDQSLSEVVVVGYSSKKKKSVTGSVSTVTLPEPVKGWEDFHAYIDHNRKEAKELSPEGLKGSVVLSFEVNRKGVPTNIKVDTSLSPRYDEEAVRLLKSGPKWKRVKGTRGKVTISFP